MKKSVRSLPPTPSLEHLRKQAKKKAREHPPLKLAAAQQQIAREYGYKNWAELAREVEALAHGGGSKGFLPLHVAARKANGPVVRWLLDHGADVNGVNPTENTALWFVCQSGAETGARLDVARMLISAGADVNRRCEKGSTALCYAAWRGPAVMVELLLSHGARNWITDNEGNIPLDYAKKSNVSENKDSIVELLSSPRMEDPIFRQAVGAITVGDLKTLKRLLKAHPNLVHSRAEENGGYAGPYFSHPFLLEFIPENPSRTRKLPPNICQITQTIIDAGASLEAINKTLGLAASGSVPKECGVQAELLEVLVRNGGDATEGLNSAISQGQWSAAEIMLRLGAKLGLEAAAGLGWMDRLRELLSSSPNMEQLAHAADAAIRGGHRNCVELLLDAGLSVNSRIPNHPYSPTLLHQAAWSGNRAIVELLLARGADITATDVQFHGTPAGWAYHGGNKELSEWLRLKEKI